MSISEQTISIVKATAPALAEHSETITSYFYQQMFSQHPELLNIFNASNQKTGRQQAALAKAICGYAVNIDNPDALTATVQRIACKHASLNILPEHYPVVGRHLLDAIAHVLGSAATDKILSAWGEAYQFLSGFFIQTEESLYRKNAISSGGWQGTRDFVVASKVQESELITSFCFKPVDSQPVADFIPGQYISIYLQPEHSKNRCIRQYSLSDAPNGENYRISVKREGEGEKSGTVSHYLHNAMTVGSTVKLSPPNGNFCLNMKAETPVILLSGGVGQTPMLSMLNTLVQNSSNRQIRYVHSALNSKVHAFGTYINALAEQHDNIKSILFYDTPTNECTGYHFVGRTRLEAIRNDIELPGAHYYFCGPVGYMSMVNNTLKTWGVVATNRHFEIFGPHEDI